MKPEPRKALFAVEKPIEKRASFLDAMCEGGSSAHRLSALCRDYGRPDAGVLSIGEVGLNGAVLRSHWSRVATIRSLN